MAGRMDQAQPMNNLGQCSWSSILQGIGKTAIFLRLKGAVIRGDPRTMDIRSMLGRMRLRALKGCIPPAEPGRHVVGQLNEFMRGLTSKARFKIATNNDVSSVAPPRSTPCSGRMEAMTEELNLGLRTILGYDVESWSFPAR
ncbi:predicted protein [Coccidioides posadasii str. Silveira]|uniref:Predicted protein n=2 Tax=Coccidioides posadasii TaxID=199306 RepID=E9CUE4_COCPS|nr:predicted protein [Coccidioides posadasii str. Silveira]KMM67082.1 hypothetical protein CPAG_03418 [Coccidioides posadasii RMSCC 3488]